MNANAKNAAILSPKKGNLVLPMLAAMTVVASAAAGTDNTFDSIYQLVKGWLEGSLGKLMAVAAFAIGMGVGLVKQSVIAVVIGLAFALIMFYGPNIMESIVTHAV
jgi:conjugal transfer pilus assembly protein TraA